MLRQITYLLFPGSFLNEREEPGNEVGLYSWRASLPTGSQGEMRACIDDYNEFEYLHLKSWHEILIGQML
jgi:hypothetical protein